jgi:putative NADH-flavin reductase
LTSPTFEDETSCVLGWSKYQWTREVTVRIAVFGATGGTGRHVVDQAVAAGHDVAVLVRDPARLTTDDARLHVVVGSVEEQDAVDRVVRGRDAVISALGTARRGPTTVCTDGVRAILGAMDREGVRRLVAVSAHGAAESRDRSLYSRVVWASQAHKMRDKESMERLIRASGSTGRSCARPA